MKIGLDGIGVKTAGRFDRVWKKLSQILQQKFNCQVIGDWEVDFFEEDAGWVHKCGDSETQKREVLILEHNPLGESERRQISHLIDSFLPPFIDLLSRHHQAAELQLQMMKQQSPEDRGSVVPLVRTPARVKKILDRSPTPALEYKGPAELYQIRQLINRLPIFIHCESYRDMSRLAFDIHDLSGNHAFIHLEDLDKEALLDPGSLQSLSSTTLFMPELSHISTPALSALKSFFANREGESAFRESPLVITGSLKDQKELLFETQMEFAFFKKLSRHQVRLSDQYEELKKVGRLSQILSSLFL